MQDLPVVAAVAAFRGRGNIFLGQAEVRCDACLPEEEPDNPEVQVEQGFGLGIQDGEQLVLLVLEIG